MIIKTDELSGAALDWAVAKVEGRKVRIYLCPVDDAYRVAATAPDGDIEDAWLPSADWSQGGPLIEKHRVSRISSNGDRSGPDPETGNHYEDISVWSCCVGFGGNGSGYAAGKTLLTAAMRAIVASKSGPEVEIPQELAP